MRGIVEVYEVGREKTLVHKSNNLIVDGAGELIADIFTTPSSIAMSGLGSGSINERILDSSNFGIHGFSLGKGSLGYKTNAHAYKKHNLLASGEYLPIEVTASATQASFPNPYDVSCTVLRVTSTAASGGYVKWDSTRIDPTFLHSLSSVPKILSYDFKIDPADFTTDSTGGYSYLTTEITHGDIDYRYTLQIHHPLHAELSANEIPGRVNSILTSETSGNYVYLKELGGGWYRKACVVPEDDYSASSDTVVKIYPASLSSVPGDSYTKSIKGSAYISRISLNAGSLPITYHKKRTTLYDSTQDLLEQPCIASSVLTYENGLYLLSRGGTLTLNPSSYDVSASLPDTPHPNDKYLQKVTSTKYEDLVDVNIFHGHNVNLGSYSRDNVSVSSIVDSSWSITSSLIELPAQKDMRLFGCFSPSSNVTLNLIPTFDATGFDNPIVTFECSGEDGFNRPSAPSMDKDGYARVYHSNLGESPTTSSTVYSITESNFSSTGEVKFKAVIKASERKMINAYGGIFEIGLHAIDYLSMLKTGQVDSTRSINKDVIDGDDIIFKLVAKKQFLYDITHQGDYGTTAGLSDERDLEIIWTLDF